MALTPLYTAAELDTEIAQAKLDLSAARNALSYGLNTGATNRQVQRERVTELQNHLVWLQGQRASLELGPGAQAHIGRPAR